MFDMRRSPTKFRSERNAKSARANKIGAHNLETMGTNPRSYTSGPLPANCHRPCSLKIALLAPAGRDGSLRGRLHEVLHDIVADLTAHRGANDGREAIMKAGPNARVRYFVAKGV